MNAMVRVLAAMFGLGVLVVAGVAVYVLLGSGDDSRARSMSPKPSLAQQNQTSNSAEQESSSSKSPAQRTLVEVTRVTSGSIQEEIRQTATLVSASVAPVYATAVGIVTSVNVEEGDKVDMGALLVQLDDEEWRLNLAQARINLARDEKEWMRQQSIDAGALQDRKEYREARYTFEAKALLVKQRGQERERQEAEARRMEVGFRENLSSEQERDQTRTAAELARIAEGQARLEWEKAREDWERVRALDAQSLNDEGAHTQAEFAFKASKVAVALAEHKVRRGAVRATMDGVVVKRQVDPGDYITTTTPLLTLADLNALKAVIHLPEIHWNTVKTGQKVVVRPEALRGMEVMGAVERVSPVVDGGTGTFKVTVSLEPDAKGRVRPGMFASLILKTAARSKALLLPRTAVLGNQEARFVMVIQPGESGPQAVRRPVRLGVTQKTMVEVREGLKGDERVVVVGQHSLKAGAPVRIRR